MYREVKMHVPEKVHEKLKHLVGRDKPMPVKVDIQEGEDILLLTPGQIIQIKDAKNKGKKSITLRFSRKQVKANIEHEGGFLSALLAMATKALPSLLTGLATGVIGGLAEKAISKSGNGLFFGKRGRGFTQIHLVEGGGLYLSPLSYDDDYDGMWLKTDNETYGSGLIFGKNSPFRNIPILGWLL